MYKCNNCNYSSNKFFALCPMCHEGLGEEVKVESGKDSRIELTNLDIKSIDRNYKDQEASLITKYDGLNAILSTSKGFIEGQVVLLGADPGVGKSTLCMSISNEDTLYISSEENFKQVNARALRVNSDAKCKILISTKIEEILTAIESTPYKFIIVDSLNSIDFGVGYQTTARYAAEITNLIKKKSKICVIISQVGKSGEITGMNSIIHVVDTVMYLERSEINNNIIASSTKNRYGEIGSVALFSHEKDGFVEVLDNEADKIKEPAIGTTVSEAFFGLKSVKICLDALVAQSQSQYGLRRVNGYNQNRVIQLVGILSYYGNLNLGNKDIYCMVSNGLYTDDVNIDLAIANSILSSYYNKSFVIQAKGQMRLNGKIMNGEIDGKSIYNIQELLNLYK